MERERGSTIGHTSSQSNEGTAMEGNSRDLGGAADTVPAEAGAPAESKVLGDDVDEEPIFDYYPIRGKLQSECLARDAALCVALHPQSLALGFESGAVVVSDWTGAIRERPWRHRQPVRSIDIDSRGRHIASGSEDGRVVVGNWSDPSSSHSIDRGDPVFSLALSPGWSEDSDDRKLVASPERGSRVELLRVGHRGLFNGLLRRTDVYAVLDDGAAAYRTVNAMAWTDNRIAWANQAQVEILDLSRPPESRRIAMHKCPPGMTPTPDIPPHLMWDGRQVCRRAVVCSVAVSMLFYPAVYLYREWHESVLENGDGGSGS